ncbi:MAG: RimK family alpha-L-glutamate ligase [Pirellulaceae bacterium]|nr:RimK family alpha-L-glutamate ligase [Planctomycetales bacterium]
MRVALLAAADSWYARDLIRAAGNRHQLQSMAFSQICSLVQQDRVDALVDGVSLTNFAAILVRTMPPGSLEQVVFRMDVLGRLEAQGACVVNPPRAIECAVDKYLSLVRLRDEGLDVPRTFLCQTADDALAAFDELNGDVVVKPLFGSEGRGICRVSDPDLALRTFKTLERLDAVLYLQEYLPHEGADLRLLVIGDDVFGMRRRHASDWRTNVSRGAVAEPLLVDPPLRQIALRATRAIGALVAGVDLLPAQSGKLVAIEVNAVPGWRALSQVTGVDIAARVLDFLETLVD